MQTDANMVRLSSQYLLDSDSDRLRAGHRDHLGQTVHYLFDPLVRKKISNQCQTCSGKQIQEINFHFSKDAGQPPPTPPPLHFRLRYCSQFSSFWLLSLQNSTHTMYSVCTCIFILNTLQDTIEKTTPRITCTVFYGL